VDLQGPEDPEVHDSLWTLSRFPQNAMNAF
jgi:hypothetical protein